MIHSGSAFWTSPVLDSVLHQPYRSILQMSHEYTAVAQLEVDSEPVEPFYDRHPNENQFPFQKGLFNVLLHTFSFAILITALFPALVRASPLSWPKNGLFL